MKIERFRKMRAVAEVEAKDYGHMLIYVEMHPDDATGLLAQIANGGYDKDFVSPVVDKLPIWSTDRISKGTPLFHDE